MQVLINYYVKSIIYYTVRSPKLEEWLSSNAITEALAQTIDKNFVDLDPLFNVNIDEDYDFRASGITRTSFCSVYLDWISYCVDRRTSAGSQEVDASRESPLVSLCLALSLLGRRALGAASHNFLRDACNPQVQMKPIGFIFGSVIQAQVEGQGAGLWSKN